MNATPPSMETLRVPSPPVLAPLAAACLATTATLLVLPYLATRSDLDRVALVTDVRTVVLPPPPTPPPTPTERPHTAATPAPPPPEAVAIRLPVQPVFDLRLNVGAGAAIPAARFDVHADGLVTAFDTGVFELSEIDQAPQPTMRLKPLYPAAARMRGLTGAVVLEFTVDTDGTTRDIAVLESEPPDVFDAAAVRAVTRWRFRPGRRQDVAVAVRVRQRVAFELEE